MIVFGKISVKAVLENRKRVISTLYVEETKKDREYRYIMSQSKGLEVKYVSRDFLDSLTESTMHGGYALDCDARISDTFQKPHSRYFCIEGVSDPYNMGEICRTIYALGFEGVITPYYNYFEHESKLIRASAGASEHLNWIITEDVKSTLMELKAQGMSVVAAHRGEESQSLVTYQFPKNVCICLGGALRGLSRNVLDVTDTFVRLDYDAKVALSTVGACSVFAYANYLQTKEA